MFAPSICSPASITPIIKLSAIRDTNLSSSAALTNSLASLPVNLIACPPAIGNITELT